MNALQIILFGMTFSGLACVYWAIDRRFKAGKKGTKLAVLGLVLLVIGGFGAIFAVIPEIKQISRPFS